MTDKLKPCPFCEHIPEHWNDAITPDETVIMVRCSWIYCPASDAEPMSIGAWNTRPLEDALLEACEATMTHLEDYPPEFYEKGRDDGRDYCIKIARAALALARGEA